MDAPTLRGPKLVIRPRLEEVVGVLGACMAFIAQQRLEKSHGLSIVSHKVLFLVVGISGLGHPC